MNGILCLNNFRLEGVFLIRRRDLCLLHLEGVGGMQIMSLDNCGEVPVRAARAHRMDGQGEDFFEKLSRGGGCRGEWERGAG